MAEVDDWVTPPASGELDDWVTPKGAPAPIATPAPKVTAQERSDATDADLVRSLGIGAAKATFTPGDVRSAASAATDWVGNKLGVAPEKVSKFKENASRAANASAIGALFANAPTSGDIRREVESVTGPYYEPKTTTGKYAETVGGMLPAVIGGPGSVGRRIGMQAVVPGVASEAAGQATKGTAAEPWARAIASVVAPIVAGRAITPLPANAGRTAHVQNLEHEGVTSISASNRVGSKNLGYAESTLGDFPFAGAGATNVQREGQRQFTEAALRRIGMNAGMQQPGQAGYLAPTRQNVDQAVHDIQNTFTGLSARSTLNLDQQFGRDLGHTIIRYERKLPQQQRDTFNEYINDLMQYPMRGQAIPGTVYQTARSDLSRIAHAARHSDPAYSEAMRGLRNAMDNAMGRSIPAADQAAWQQARRQWANWRTIETAAKKSDDFGNVRITPGDLVNSASVRDRGAFARGLGDYAGLAQSGDTVMKSMPQSGTQPRVLFTAATAALGAGAAAFPGIAAGIAAPALIGRTLMGRPAQSYLANQALLNARGTVGDAASRALATAQNYRVKYGLD